MLEAVVSEEECMGREERRREATLLIQATFRMYRCEINLVPMTPLNYI